MPHVQTEVHSTSSKPVRTVRSNTTSTSSSSSSKESTSNMERASMPRFEDFRKYGGSGGVSLIDGYATQPRHQDPWLAGEHIGKRTQDRLNLANDLDDLWKKANGSAHKQVESSSTAKPKPIKSK